ncbi:MAG TPA: CPBP family intramembrane glutamic endopeptidase [Acidimicrobiia bacterium]|nr:CPBP family intramembrane glutamic endopeptidase [Acidimicrobiia bacterium]
MSAVLPAPRPAVAAPRAAVLVAAAGCAALTARPLLLEAVGRPGAVVTVLFVGLLTVSLLWPGAREGVDTTTSVRAALPVLAIGVGAFAVGRALLAGAPPPAPATAFVVTLNTLAAVAEEAFFRRLVYGALLAAGPVAAVVGSAVLFAAVHVTVYGLWVLPLDLAAGLLFGWQRQATGSWAVPAATHAVANVLVVL